MPYSLNMLKKGEACTVINVNGEGPFIRRLFDMGITPGVVIIIKRIAPLGDPMQITLRGYDLIIRKKDAKMIDIELLNPRER